MRRKSSRTELQPQPSTAAKRRRPICSAPAPSNYSAPSPTSTPSRSSSPSPEKIRSLVARRSHQARDHQLPHLQARARRPLLRPHLWTHHRLGVPLRQVQAHEAPRRHLRQVRRRSHPQQGPPRTPRPHRARQPLLARLVLQGPAVAHRPPARHLACVSSKPSSTSSPTSSSIQATRPSRSAKSSRTRPASASSTSSTAPPASRP